MTGRRFFNRAFCLFALFFILQGTGAFAQCPNSLTQIGNTSEGKIVVQVKSGVKFSGQLLAYENATKKVIKEFSGTSDQRFTFESLNPVYTYRVIVFFDNTTDFLCRNKVLDGIEIKTTTPGAK